MEEVAARIEDLKTRAVERETMRYPAAFKEDATELVADLREEGWTQQAISEDMQIPWQTLCRWRKSEEPTEEHSRGFRPVTVVDAENRPVLVSPSGWRIEGLTVMELVEVARRLS